MYSVQYNYLAKICMAYNTGLAVKFIMARVLFEFSSPTAVQTGSGTHLTSHQMGTGGSFPAGKTAGA
jgi:hypothetical protein